MLNYAIPIGSETGIALDIMSLAVLVPIMISLAAERNFNKMESRVLSFVLMANTMSIICDGVVGFIWETGSDGIVTLLIIMSFCFFEVCLFLFILYQYIVLSKRTFISDIVVYGGAFALGVIIILYLVGGFEEDPWFITLKDNALVAKDSYVVPYVINAIVASFSFFLSISCRKFMENRELHGWCIFMILPIIAVTFTPSVCVICASVSVSIVILSVVIHNGHIQDVLYKENELDKSQMKLMVSQIQPHFMYNSLNSIYYLIGKEPDTAKKAVSVFSEYLRQNVNSLKSDSPVAFTEEINHTKAYLYLEQLRFGDELQVEFDLQETDFRIPPLTVQPLVENAVKHGVSVKPGGGRVRVTSARDNEGFVIVIADDGVGFKVGDQQGAGAHIGLLNVKKRLDAMCGGTLEVESFENVGTICTIKLPLEGQKNL